MEEVKEFTLMLIKGLVKQPDFVKVQDFSDEDGVIMLEIIVHSDDMSTVIGKSGKTIKAVKTLINTAAYKQNIKKLNINVDSI